MSTHTQKRPPSPPEPFDPRSPRKLETADGSDTLSPASGEAAASKFTLEFLPDSYLPHRRELQRLNSLIHGDIQTLTGSGQVGIELPSLVVLPVLQILDKHCDFLDAQPCFRSIVKDMQTLHEIHRMAQEAYQHADYSRLMLIKGLQCPPPPRTPSDSEEVDLNLPFGSSIPSKIQEAIVGGWNAPFIGTAHTTLARNIQEMFKEAMYHWPNRKYMTHASLTQSSGSGKSRLLDKVAETIFTIPFNVRDASDAGSGAWPPYDADIYDVLVPWTKREGKKCLYAQYLSFFAAVFEEVRKEIEQHIPQPASENTASAWRNHLAENWSEHRKNLYARVANSDAIQDARTFPYEHIDSAKVSGLRTIAREALKQLLGRVCPDTACRASHTGKHGSTVVGNIHVLIYFDEVHVLANLLARSDASLSEDKTALDVLFTVFDDFRPLGLFGVFMSTQSHLEHLESKAAQAPFSSSARRLVLPPYTHAPITETPFDCFGDRRIVPSRLRANDLCDVAFMACFGRPMWRSLMLPFCDKVLAKASGTAHDASYRPSYDDRDLLTLAMVKLVFHGDPYRERSDFSRTAQTAVLDVRIMLPFEPRSSAAYSLQMELVASHMRTIYSIPQNREYVHSGYPSEPLLAEAAARQLHEWRTQGEKFEPGFAREPAALILAQNIDDALLDRGEIGEAVGRMLLVLARDRAALETVPRLLFSHAVPVNAFVKALLSPAVAQAVLDSRPDNLAPDSSDVTFAEAFKDAVLNFTHFARWEDGSVPDECAAVGCFVRSMAVVCRKTASKVDAFIPVLLDRSAYLRPEVMTGILIRINRKQGKTKSVRPACPIVEADVGLFDSTPLVEGRRRPQPYISLIMELGFPDPPSSYTDTAPADVSSSIPVVVGQPPRQTSDRVETVRHPRYSIAAYGCSHSVYGVIAKHESAMYGRILRRGDVLQEHPRQDSLNLLQMQKPAFSTEDASWDWIAKDDSSLDAGSESVAAGKGKGIQNGDEDVGMTNA